MWNWEQPEWPKFRWDQTRLDKAGQTFVIESGVFAGSVKHVDESGLSTITVEALSTEAATTSEIQGEMLDRASVQSSVRRELGLNPDARRSGPKEQGIAKMMVNVHRTFAEPLSEDTLCSWHAMVMKGRDLRDAGRYRTGDERDGDRVGPLRGA